MNCRTSESSNLWTHIALYFKIEYVYLRVSSSHLHSYSIKSGFYDSHWHFLFMSIQIQKTCVIVDSFFQSLINNLLFYHHWTVVFSSLESMFIHHSIFYNSWPQIRQDNPLNLSILLSGGKETNKDTSSNGEWSRYSSSLKSLSFNR